MERDCRKKQYDHRNKNKRNSAHVHTASVQNQQEDNDPFIQAFVAINQNFNVENLWLFDTGATHHLTHSRNLLHDYIQLATPLEVRFGDNAIKLALGKGTVHLSIDNEQTISISNVYYVPGLAKNLLSVSEATTNGAIIEFHHNCAIIKYTLSSGKVVKIVSPKHGRLYPLQAMDKTPIEAHSASRNSQVDHTLLWHYRLRHLHPRVMKTCQIHKLGEGMPTQPFTYLSLCEGCIYGKQTRQKFPLSKRRSERKLQLVHSDLCGPFQKKSISGNHYFISFIDDFSRFTMLYFLKKKSEAFQAFTYYKSMAENQCQSKINSVRSDNGGEYVSNEWQNFCNVHGIRHELNVPHNPQQNGVAERKNRTLLDASRSMLQVAGLEHRFWQEAVATSCYLQNRSPHKVLGLHTPYMVWFGHKPDFSNLRVFGSIAYSHIPQEKRKKLDPHAKKCIMVGYGEAAGVKGYKLFDPSNQKFIFSRSVTFDEDALFYNSEQSHEKMEMQDMQNQLHNGNDLRKERRHIEEPLRMEENTNLEMTLVEWQQPAVSTATTIVPVATTKIPTITSTVPKVLPIGQTTTTTGPVFATTTPAMDRASASTPFLAVNNKDTIIRNDSEPIHSTYETVDSTTNLEDSGKSWHSPSDSSLGFHFKTDFTSPKDISSVSSHLEPNLDLDSLDDEDAYPRLPTRRSKFRSLKEIMEIIEPLEALMADLSPEVDFAQDDFEILDNDDFSPSAEEAIHGPDSVKWKEAMQLEIDTLLKNDTWELVKPPEN